MKTKNKKGISIMVSYVLLVVIAVSLSTLLYAFLKLYVPKEKPECKDGINIAIQDVQCISKTLTVTLQNRGRFKISAVYIRIGNASREFRQWINDPIKTKNYEGFYPLNETLGPGLFPGETKKFPKTGLFPVNSTVVSNGQYTIEVQPAVYTGKAATPEDLALCPAITQTINCTA